MQKTDYDLSKDANLWNINDLDEETRAILQGLSPGQINAVLGYKNVKVENVAFITESANLINESKLKTGFTLSGTTGEEVANALNSVSDFIPATPATPYRMAGVARWAVYNANKEFIASSTVQAINGDLAYDSHYIKVVVSNSVKGTGVVQLNKGTTLLPYTAYSKPKLADDIGINLDGIEAVPKDGSVTGAKIPEREIGTKHLNFIRRSSNLMNPNGAMVGYAVSGTTGEPVVNAVNTLTDFIPIKSSQMYKIAFVNRTAFYDANKVFISSNVFPSEITSPSNAKYARFAVTSSSLRERAQLNEGSTLLTYEPYYVYLDGVGIESTSSEVSIVSANKYVERLYSDEIYTAPLLEDRSTTSQNNLKELLYSDIHNLYADLKTRFPNYVTSQLLGTEATGRELYRYDFKPPQTSAAGVKSLKFSLLQVRTEAKRQVFG